MRFKAKMIPVKVTHNFSGSELVRHIRAYFPNLRGVLKLAFERVDGSHKGGPEEHSEDIAEGRCPRCGTDLEVVP